MGDAVNKIFTTHGPYLIYRHGLIWPIQFFFMLYLAHIVKKEKAVSVSEINLGFARKQMAFSCKLFIRVWTELGKQQ